jgi:D-galactarolactone cycloisomerase
MKIEKIITYHTQCKLNEENIIKSSQKAFDTREIAIVKVFTDEGLIGVGESLGRPDIVIPIIHKTLKPLIIGTDPTNITHLWQTMLGGSWFRAQTGIMVEALSAIDIALWDLKGKILNNPVFNLLGGAFRKEIPVYATGLYLNTPGNLEKEANEHLKNGFRAMKLKIGYPEGIKRDLERIKLIRSLIGPETKLMLDANCKYDISTATALAEHLPQYDISWLEEPLAPIRWGPHHDLKGYMELKQKISIPISWGEGEYLLTGLKDFLVQRCIDIIQPDVCRSGGITETARIIQTAELFAIRYAPHFWTSGIGLAATLHLAASAGSNFYFCEYDQSANDLRKHLVSTPFDVKNGKLNVPEGSGLGIELDEKMLSKYAIAVEE